MPANLGVLRIGNAMATVVLESVRVLAALNTTA